MMSLMRRPSKKLASMQGLFESWGGRTTNDLLPGSRKFSKRRNAKALRTFSRSLLREVLLDMEEAREEALWEARMDEEFHREYDDDREYDEDQEEESALDDDLNFEDSDESWDLPDWQG